MVSKIPFWAEAVPPASRSTSTAMWATRIALATVARTRQVKPLRRCSTAWSPSARGRAQARTHPGVKLSCCPGSHALVASTSQKVQDFMVLSSAKASVQCPIASEIAPPNIKMGDSDRDDHHGHAVAGVSHKAEGDAVAFSDAGDREVGRRADEGAVAAEAGSERQAPPKRLDLVRAAIRGRHALDQGDHGGDEGNVVDDCRQEGRRPQDGEASVGHVAPGRCHKFVGEEVKQAADLDAVHHDKQSDEEEDRDPFHIAEGLMHVGRLRFVVMLTVIEKAQRRRARYCNGGGFEVQRASEHEAHDDRGQYYKRLPEQ